MSEITRREAIHRLAMSIGAAGAIDRLAAQHVHHAAAGLGDRRGRTLRSEGAVDPRVPYARIR